LIKFDLTQKDFVFLGLIRENQILSDLIRVQLLFAREFVSSAFICENL